MANGLERGQEHALTQQPPLQSIAFASAAGRPSEHGHTHTATRPTPSLRDGCETDLKPQGSTIEPPSPSSPSRPHHHDRSAHYPI